MKLDKNLIRELAQLSDSERAILSIYLDLTKGWDAAEKFVHQETRRLLPLMTVQERDYFETSLSFFHDAMDALKQKNARIPGLAFFADLGANYTRMVELDTPPKPLLAVDDEVIIHPLALIYDEFEPIGIIMVDASGARILLTAGEQLEDADALRTKIHHLSKVGGWSQMRYQRRRAKQVQHFSKEIIERALEIFKTENVHRIIIAGRDRMITALEKEMPLDLKKRIIATLRWDLDETDTVFLKKIKPIMERAERDQEERLLARLVSELRRSGLAVKGIKSTREALTRGQVDTLFLTLNLDKHLVEELVSIAESTAAHVEFVPTTRDDLQQDGVAALLRYRIP
jgi:peptide chain release factor subunit 1